MKYRVHKDAQTDKQNDSSTILVVAMTYNYAIIVKWSAKL